MILSIDIFYFNTVIIGGPIIFKAMRIILRTKKEGIYQGTGCNSTKYIDLICSWLRPLVNNHLQSWWVCKVYCKHHVEIVE